MPNIYYEPEKSGLTLIDELEQSNMDYHYDMLIIVQDNKTKNLFIATDSGCSWPVPFEGYSYNSPEDNNLDKVELHNIETLIDGWHDTEYGHLSKNDINKTIIKLKRLLNGNK